MLGSIHDPLPLGRGNCGRAPRRAELNSSGGSYGLRLANRWLPSRASVKDTSTHVRGGGCLRVFVCFFKQGFHCYRVQCPSCPPKYH